MSTNTGTNDADYTIAGLLSKEQIARLAAYLQTDQELMDAVSIIDNKTYKLYYPSGNYNSSAAGNGKELLESVGKKAEEKIGLLSLDDMMEGYQVIGFDWRYIYINDAAAKHGKSTKEFLIGKTMQEAYPGIEQTEVFQLMKACMEEKKHAAVENKFTYPDASFGWFELNIQPIPEGLLILSVDITEKKKAAELLLKSQEDYSVLFSDNPQPMFIFDMETLQFVEVNKAAVDYYGYSRDEFLQLRLKDLRTNVPEETIRHTVDNEKTEQKIFRSLQHKKKDGSTRIIDAFAHDLDFAGRPSRHVMVVDVTEKEQTLELLRQRESDFNTMFRENAQPMYVFDLDTLQFLAVNEAALNFYGYSNEEFMQLYLYDIRTLESREEVMQYVHKTKGQNKILGEVKQQLHSGSIVTVEIYSHDLIFNGRPARNVMVVDVTEKRKTEEELRKSESRFRALIENVNESIVIRDKNFKMVYASPFVKKVLGYKQDEELDPVFENDTHPDEIEILQNLRAQAEENPGIPIHATFRKKCKDGSYMWADGFITNMLHIEGVNGFVSNFRDVTEIKDYQNKLEEQKLLLELAQETGKIGHRIHEYIPGSDKPKVTWSKQMYKLHGWDEGVEISYEKIWKMIHPEDVAHLQKALNETVRAGRISEMDYRIIWDDGSIHWLNSKIFPMLFKGRKVIFGISKDITEQKNIEQRLLRKRRVLYAYFNSTDEAICIVDKNGIILAFNNVFENGPMTINKEVIEIGKQMVPCLRTEFYTEVKNAVANAFEGTETYTEITISLNNSTRWWRLHVIPVRDETERGEINSVAVSLTDIDNQKKVLNDLALSNERYEFTAKATSDAIWDWDMRTDRFYRGEGFKELFGYLPKDFEGNSKDWEDRIHPEDLQRVQQRFNELENSGETKWVDEYRYRKANGTYAYVRDKGIIIRDRNGVAVRMIGAMQDITLRKIEEQRLKMLEAVVTQTKDIVLITEAQAKDNTGRKTVYVNNSFYNITGYTPEEIIGKNPKMLQGPLSDKKQLEKLGEAIRKWESCEIETINYKKDGTPYYVHMSVMPISNEKGEFTNWVAVQRDITEARKREEEKAQLIEELTIRNNELKQFSFIASHNLRAPLTNLLSIADIVKKIPVENQKLKLLLEGYETSAYKLSETLDDLIQILLVRESSGIALTEVHFNDAFEKAKDLLAENIKQSGALIHCDFARQSVLFNDAYMGSIFFNLLSNSLRFTVPGRRPEIHIRSFVENNSTCLQFRDNGAGMDIEKIKHKMFGLYQKFHRNLDGKGMGLFLIKSQLTALGGSIDVKSSVSEGTIFTIRFKPSQE